MFARKVSLKTSYCIRLARGEEVMASLKDFCKRENIVSGSFRAIGAVEKANVGYFDRTTREYGSVVYPDVMEVASLIGNVALVEGEPFIHAHVVLTKAVQGMENQAWGGHLFDATVAVTLEIYLDSFTESVERVMDESIGLKLLAL